MDDIGEQGLIRQRVGAAVNIEGAIRMAENAEDGHLWEVWAHGPKTKDAELVLKWSKTSFFIGCPMPNPKIIDGMEFMLYHRCTDEAWALKRFEHAQQFFTDIRLWVGGEQIKSIVSTDRPSDPDDDMLGAHSKLGITGGSC